MSWTLDMSSGLNKSASRNKTKAANEVERGAINLNAL